MSSSSLSDHTDKTGDSVVLIGLPLLTKNTMRIKGGDAHDYGLSYTNVSIDEPFNSLLHYAQRTGVRPPDLRFYNRGQLITPAETPYQRDFCKDEIVLAYNTEGEPVSANLVGVTIKETKYFHICDLFEPRNTFQFRAKNTTPVLNVYVHWGSDHRDDHQRIRLRLNGVDLDDRLTVEEAGIGDGAYIDAHIEQEGFERRSFLCHN